MKENIIDYFIKNKLLFILVILLYLIVILLSIIFYFKLNTSNVINNKNLVNNESVENKINLDKKDGEKKNDNYIYVDIKGNVKNPGVYKIKENSRVVDVIKQSGGLLKDSNTRFNNMSKILKDGDVIVIYTNKEIEDAKKSNTIYVETPCVCEEIKNDSCYTDDLINNNDNNILININTATIDELDKLNGIGKSKAQNIIDYRNKNGNFNKLEDLLKVNGISETIFNKIKENITL